MAMFTYMCVLFLLMLTVIRNWQTVNSSLKCKACKYTDVRCGVMMHHSNLDTVIS